MDSKNIKTDVRGALFIGISMPILAEEKEDIVTEETVEEVNEETTEEIVSEIIEDVEENSEADSLEVLEIEEEIEEKTTSKAVDTEFDPSLFTINFDTPGIALISNVPVSDNLYIPGEFDFGNEGVRRLVITTPKIFNNKVKHLVIAEVNGQKVGIETQDLSTAFGDESVMETADLRGLDVSQVTDMKSLFTRNSSLKDLNVEGWDTGNVTDMKFMFYYASTLKEINLNSWDVSKVKDTQNMFAIARSLETIHFADWQLDSVENLRTMFYSSPKLRNIDVSKWKTPNAKNMYGMFWVANGLTLDLKDWDVSNVETMEVMFYFTKNIPELDLSNWDVSNVKNFDWMFTDSQFETIKLDHWNTESAQSMERMFAYNRRLKDLDVNHFKTSNVDDMHGMFDGITMRYLDLSNWDVSNVETMDSMFYKTPELKILNLSGWETKAGVDLTETFLNYDFSTNSIIPVEKLIITTDPHIKAYDFARDLNSPLEIASFNANTIEEDGSLYGSFSDGDLIKDLTLQNITYDSMAAVDSEIQLFTEHNTPEDERPDSPVSFNHWIVDTGEKAEDFVQAYINNGKETYEARWSNAILTYNANTTDTSLSGDVPETLAFTIGDTLTVAANTGNLERLGYKFIGWSTNPTNDEDDIIYGQDAQQTPTITPTDSLTLYAVWKEYEQTINWHLNNGDDTVQTTHKTNEFIELIDEPLKEGHVFIGWYQDEALTKPIFEYMEALEENADINFYAKYEEKIVEPEKPEEKEDVEVEETKTKDKDVKTGIRDTSILTISIMIISIVSVIVLKKKKNA